ncbi:MAG TPA: SDR family NAD(P)-dependent oxidoreductase, partial [Roseimicrobium sp.]|nr:SDR family NAD(P)-dependent oxidoreductase [Roseimicrobium sp.]
MPPATPTHVIFGAAGGIGSALCRRLSKSGANLILAGRTLDTLTALADELGAIAIQCDATRLAQVNSVFELARSKHGQVDGVANCVGS